MVSAGRLVGDGINRESPKEVGLVSVVFTCGNTCEEKGLGVLSGIAAAEVGFDACLSSWTSSTLPGEEKRLLPNKRDVFHVFRYMTPREKAAESAQEVELRRRRLRVKNCSFHIVFCSCVVYCPSRPHLTPCFFSSSPNPANVL